MDTRCIRSRRTVGRQLTKATIYFCLLSLSLVGRVASGQSSEGLKRSGRWFTYDGRPTYLVGWDYQALASDPTVDYVRALDLFVQYRINKVRVWVYCWFGGPDLLAPYTYSRALGKYDLDMWNAAYWQRMRNFIAAAQSRNIIVELSIFAPNHSVGSENWASRRFQAAENKLFNINGVFTAGSDGDFHPDYFNLNHPEVSTSGKRLRDYQQELLDKTVAELGSYSNVYFEICNEFPIEFDIAKNTIDSVYPWQQFWARRLKSITPRLVAGQAHQGSGNHSKGIEYFWNESSIDVLNFHFWNPSPKDVSDILHDAQSRGKVLSVNESLGIGEFSGVAGQALDSQMLLSWGMFLAGGYSALYGGDPDTVGTPLWIEASKRLKALRDIVERVRFWEMSPVDASDNEFDSLITQGPGGRNWQLIANPGSQYLAYFWGKQSNTSVKISLPSGAYEYQWYDPRDGTMRLSGRVSGGGTVTIPSPKVTVCNFWPDSVLIISRSAAQPSAAGPAFEPRGDLEGLGASRRNIDVPAGTSFLGSTKFVSSADNFTGITVINLSLYPATLTFVALDNSGEVISEEGVANPTEFTLDPDSQTSGIISGLFRFDDSRERTGWLAVFSDQPQVVGYVSTGATNLARLDAVSLFRGRLYQWIAPEIIRKGRESAELNLVNADCNQASYAVSHVLRSGTVRETQTDKPAPPANRQAQLFDDLFPRPEETADGYLRMSSEQGLLFTEFFGTDNALGALNGIELNRYIDVKKVYSPQFAILSGFKTILNVINGSGEDAEVTITLHRSDGAVVGRPYQKTMAKDEQIKEDLAKLFEDQTEARDVTGWLEIESSRDRIVGTVTFTDDDRSFLTSFELSGTPQSRFLFPILAHDSIYQTGIALLNPNEEGVTVTLEIWGRSGTKDRSTTVTLSGKTRTALYLDSYFSALEPRLTGHIRVRSDKPIYGISLINDRELTFISAVPAISFP